MSPAGVPGSRPSADRRLSVELVGIPGAGKSRRARSLAEGLRDRGVPVRQPQTALGPAVPAGSRLRRKAVACGAAALSAPGDTFHVTRALLRSGQPKAADVAGRAVQWLVAQRLLVRARHLSGVTLLDEGPVQSLWSTGLRGDIAPVLEALSGGPRWHSPDVLVVVRTSPEVALERLTRRSSQHSRTQLLPPEERREELERGARLLEELVGWWAAQVDPLRVLNVAGDEDSAGERQSIVSTICTLLKKSAADGAGSGADGVRAGS